MLRRFFFRDDGPLNLRVLRIVVALNALWIVLSRPTLIELFAWPDVLWRTVPQMTRVRFLLLFGPRVEWPLWIALHALLLLVLFNVATRWTALASALLLYHFAPLESIFNGANPYLRGFTITTIALLAIAAAAPVGQTILSVPRGKKTEENPGGQTGLSVLQDSWRNRWPVAVVQFVFVTMYFFAGWAKVLTSGMEWISPRNMRLVIVGLDQVLSFPGGEHGALWIARSPLLAAGLGIGGVLFELLFPLALFSRRAAMVLALAAAVFHVANYLALHIHFPELALLLVFVDWHALLPVRTMPGCPQSSVTS
ncbi:MAG TPA: HTTM domain-containing protein [Thermoanaerobaculia bacterium]|jgi:hypothetical protein